VCVSVRGLVVVCVLVVASVARAEDAASSPDAGAVASASDPVRVVGWLEPVVFPEAGLRLVAKLDTGAKTSSLDAEELEHFDRGGEKWVRFKLRKRKDSDDRRAFEARLVSEKTVRTAHGSDRRTTVALWMCVAGERRRVLFTLGSREALNYRVILGRRALEGRLAVDVSRKFTTEPGCPSEPAK